MCMGKSIRMPFSIFFIHNGISCESFPSFFNLNGFENCESSSSFCNLHGFVNRDSLVSNDVQVPFSDLRK